MDETEALKCRVLRLFPEPNTQPFSPPLSMSNAPPLAPPGSSVETEGFVDLPPPMSPSSIPRPPAASEPQLQPIPSGNTSQPACGPNDKQKTVPRDKTAQAAAEFWNDAAPVDPARADEILSAIVLTAMMDGALDLRVARAHLAAVLANETDPVRRMLLESFVLLHHQLNQQQVLACRVSDPQRIQAYNVAVARLVAEQTRLASILWAHSASEAIKTPSSSTPPMKTEPVADNQSAAVEPFSPTNPQTPAADQGELASKEYEESFNKHGGAKAKESAPRRSGDDQRPAETTVAA